LGEERKGSVIRYNLEEEDDAAEKAHEEKIRVFPGKLAYLIYK
jgi:hypothetical protein